MKQLSHNLHQFPSQGKTGWLLSKLHMKIKIVVFLFQKCTYFAKWASKRKKKKRNIPNNPTFDGVLHRLR